MKNLSLILILVSFTLQFGFSQTNTTNVKRQYMDKVNTETTVVVKQGSASDMDVLSSQFNLNDVSMGEVIFIKTEDLAPSKPKSERTSFSQMVQESTKPARTVASQPVVAQPTATPQSTVNAAPVRKSSRAASARPQMRAKTNTTKSKALKTVAKKSVAPKTTTRSSRYTGTGTLRKVKTKRVKLKKRKRVKRGRRNKCFSF